jgi:hypothetical protein
MNFVIFNFISRQMVDVEAIIKYLYRITYMLLFFKLINLAVFLKWEHIGFKIDIISGVLEMSNLDSN